MHIHQQINTLDKLNEIHDCTSSTTCTSKLLPIHGQKYTMAEFLLPKKGTKSTM